MAAGEKWYPEADLVIKHPTIYTVDITCEEVTRGMSDFQIIEDGGVAVKDGKIIQVGKSGDVDTYIGEKTKVILAEGQALIPGFVESHMHCTWTGNNLRTIDFSKVTSREVAKQLIIDKVAQARPGEWIKGNSWNELVWDVQEPFTARELDEIAPENPVFCMRTCFHTCMTNSRALEAAGITRDTPDPEGGTIGHYDDGAPNGMFYENSAMDLIQAVIPPLTEDERVASLVGIGEVLNSLGITSAIDCNLNFDEMRAYLETKNRGKLSFRSNLMFYLDSAYGDRDVHLRRLEEADCITGFGDDMLKMNGVKVTLDGIPATYTALMREPYKTNPDTCGSSVWTQEDITAFVCKAHELGWQFGIHTIGDATADMALNAFEEANKIKPITNEHHYLIHYQFPQDDQWPIMRKLNIGVALQPTIVSTMGEAPQFFDHQVSRIQSPGLLFKNGILAGGSSDSPVVSPDPRLGMYYAITRLDETTGNILGEESRVTPNQALIMYTKNAAWFSHDEDKLGSIEVGNLADLVLMDRPFLSCDVEEYREMQVLKTILGGEVVYEA